MCEYFTATNVIALGSLVVSAVSLYYLVKYVGYTKGISVEAVRQTEASSKPVIIAIPGAGKDDHSKLRNVGKGPALDVEWRITNTDHKGPFSCIEADNDSPEMIPSNLEELVVAATKSPSGNDVAIVCSYKSISGTRYRSNSKHSLSLDGAENDRFDTTFEEIKKGSI
jgi:hypothetical protein